MANIKWSAFGTQTSLGINDHLVGYRNGVDNWQISYTNFITTISIPILHDSVMTGTTSVQDLHGPFSPEPNSLLGYNASGNLDNVVTDGITTIIEDGILRAIAAGTGNVVSDGTASINQFALYSSGGGYDVTQSPLLFSGGIITTDTPFKAEYFTAQGSAPIPGPGTLTVTNGSAIISGDSTLFNTTFGPKSGVLIEGVPYTVIAVYGDLTAQLSVPYAGADDSGVPYFVDASFLNFNSVAGVDIFSVGNYGALSWPNITSASFTPAIIPVSLGAGTVSGLFIQADSIQAAVSDDSHFSVTNFSNLTLLDVVGATGSAALSGDLTLGNGATPGRSLFMPTNVFDTFNPNLVSSNNGNFSFLTFNSDNYVFNVAPTQSFTVNGGMIIDGAYQNNLGSSDTYQVLGGGSTYGLVMYGNNPVYNYTAIDTFFYGTPGDGFPVAFSIGGAGVQLNKYQVNTLFNMLDDGITGNMQVMGAAGFGTPLDSNYRISSDGAIMLTNSFDIPPPPADGIAIFSQYDADLGHSLGFYIDSAGNVSQIGEGTGGGGTVTLVDVSADLTVDGVPNSSFTVDGTIGMTDKGTPGTYNFGNGFVTTDAKGQITAATSATNLVTDVTASSPISSSGGTTPVISLDNKSGATAGTYQFAQFDLDAKGLVNNVSNLGLYSSTDSNIWLNGTGTTARTGVTFGSTLGVGADAMYNDMANYIAIGNGALAGNSGVSIGTDAGSSATNTDKHVFLGQDSSASVNGLVNVAALGYGTKIAQSNSFNIGGGTISTGFNQPAPQSTLHVVSNATSGTMGTKGVFRLNGINDTNTWPVTDKVWMQNAIIQDGVVTDTILTIPISNALGGCITAAKIEVSCILGNGGPGISSYTGSIVVRGAFDGSPGAFYINGVSTTTPVSITLSAGTTDTTLALATATVQLSGTTGPGVQSLLVKVTGINANFVNWNAWCEYFTTQATATV